MKVIFEVFTPTLFIKKRHKYYYRNSSEGGIAQVGSIFCICVGFLFGFFLIIKTNVFKVSCLGHSGPFTGHFLWLSNFGLKKPLCL